MRLFVVGLVALLVMLLLIWSGYSLLNTLTAIQISRLGNDYLGVEVATKKVRVNLFSGEIMVSGLTVANPPAFSEGPFVEVGHLFLHADPLSFLSDQGRIYEIRAKPVHLEVEQKGGRFNYQIILENLEAKQGLKTARIADSASSIKIDRILLEDVQTRVRLVATLAPIALNIGTVKIRDVDSSDGAAALRQILERMLDSATSGRGTGFLGNAARNILESLLGSNHN